MTIANPNETLDEALARIDSPEHLSMLTKMVMKSYEWMDQDEADAEARRIQGNDKIMAKERHARLAAEAAQAEEDRKAGIVREKPSLAPTSPQMAIRYWTDEATKIVEAVERRNVEFKLGILELKRRARAIDNKFMDDVEDEIAIDFDEKPAVIRAKHRIIRNRAMNDLKDDIDAYKAKKVKDDAADAAKLSEIKDTLIDAIDKLQRAHREEMMKGGDQRPLNLEGHTGVKMAVIKRFTK